MTPLCTPTHTTYTLTHSPSIFSPADDDRRQRRRCSLPSFSPPLPPLRPRFPNASRTSRDPSSELAGPLPCRADTRSSYCPSEQVEGRILARAHADDDVKCECLPLFCFQGSFRRQLSPAGYIGLPTTICHQFNPAPPASNLGPGVASSPSPCSLYLLLHLASTCSELLADCGLHASAPGFPSRFPADGEDGSRWVAGAPKTTVYSRDSMVASSRRLLGTSQTEHLE